MAIEILKALQVKQARDCELSDGGGLLLRVCGESANFVFRFTAPSGKRREMGLGAARRSSLAAAGASLVAARREAQRQREFLLQGSDPIDLRRQVATQAKAAAQAKLTESKREHMTLARVGRAYHERVIEPNRTRKHAAQWIASLEQHVPDDLWHRPIAEIDAPALLDAVAEVQVRLPETASRIRQRLEAIFDDAEFRKMCHGNPARAIRRKLRETKRGRERGHFAALPYRDAPAFIAQLRERAGIAARALEFAALTAARTGEVIGAEWPEFDLRSGVWTVPPARMKGGTSHTVYLPTRAIEILVSMQEHGQPYVFPAPALDGRSISNMAMLTLLRRMDASKKTTVHGLCRSTFSTWSNECGIARPDVIEACLAHREADLVRQAYNRAEFAAERRALLQTWANFLDGKTPASNVIHLPIAA